MARMQTGIAFATQAAARRGGVPQHANAGGSRAAATAAAPAAAWPPFPVEPFLALAVTCQLDAPVSAAAAAAAAAAGGQQQREVHSALSYRLLLDLSQPGYYRPGDASGAVAAGFSAAANVTLHIEQVLVWGCACRRSLPADTPPGAGTTPS
jgi:hypothetical protein